MTTAAVAPGPEGTSRGAARHPVALVGCGPRGEMHARGVLANPDRLDLVAVCDLDGARLARLGSQLAIPRKYTDAHAMLAAEKPDVLCFATPPQVRLPLVELGIKHGVKAIAYEKPMALTLAEARRITDLCAESGVKTVVCHQLKYGAHWQTVKQLVDSGQIGEPHTIHATARLSMLRVGTHLTDSMLWLNGGHRGVWVIGQVHGQAAYGEDHPCPDHVTGTMEFANGVRGILECGTLAPRLLDEENFWGDGSVTVYGTHGYARAVIGAGWQAVTRSSGGQLLGGPPELTPQEPRFMRALADWLDDSLRVHPCNGDISYHGFELLMAMGLSSLERRRVELPIGPVLPPILERLKQELPGPARGLSE